MGLSGLTLAWQQARDNFGSFGLGVVQALGGFALALMAVLLVLSLWRAVRWPQAMRQEWMHPVRHVFVATVPASLILLATVGVAMTGVQPVWDGLWMTGATLQLGVTVAVVARWLSRSASRWVSVTPALLIPVVGNVLVPLAGLALGHAQWAWWQWLVGACLWPVVVVLIVLRLRRLGPWPERMRPSVFVLVAPPSVVGMGLLLWSAPVVWSLACWALALVTLLLAFSQLPRCLAQPFAMPLWSLSFPLAAFASLSLRLSQAGVLPGVLALMALALASVVIAMLLRWTFWGLRSGQLLQAEPQPVAATRT